MPSNYQAFRLVFNDEYGRTQAFPSVSVKVRTSADNYAADLTTLTTNSDGEVASGSLSVAAGTRVRFRVENYLGLAASLTQITT
jgi:5-hydroxyisourate hydrolase-like protein (transthyretin family)